MVNQITMKQAHQTFSRLCQLLNNHRTNNYSTKLQLLKNAVTWIGKFLYTYLPESELTTQYNDEILPGYKSIADEESVALMFKQVLAMARQLRDELAE